MAEHVVATTADNPRSATPGEIQEAAVRTHAETKTAADMPTAIIRARELAGEDGIVVISGSIYIVGEAMRALGVGVE